MTRSDMPQGTVTFLFADIEGSADLSDELGDGYPAVEAASASLLRRAVRDRGGLELEVYGDRYRAVFASAIDAAACAVDVQRSFVAEAGPGSIEVRVRIGLHTGEARVDDGRYAGTEVRRTEQIAHAGHGGQIVLSAVTAALNERHLPPETRLRDCGTHELRDLAYPEHLYQLVVEGLREDFPPLRTLSALKSNLPEQKRQFVGRIGETSRLLELLKDERLVTLTGAAGIGKTSLAIRAASRAADQFADGVWLVDISRVGDAGLVPSAVAKQLNINESGPQSLTELILSRLLRSSLLLVLDGCEHLVAEVRDFVAEVLGATSHVKVLVTSREALAISSEKVVRVTPLATPPNSGGGELATYDSVALFVDRARRIDPAFDLDDASGPIVAQICRQLDGLPLAIELAAAQLRDASLDEVAQRLDRRPASKRAVGKGAGPSHETLGATLDWSYESLSDEERLLFARLAVFSGGFTRQAAEKVCGVDPLDPGAVGDLLDRLVATSLVVLTPGAPDRYRLLGPIAQYARRRLTQLGGIDDIRPRHAAHYLELAEAAEPGLRGPRQAQWVNTLEAERYNLRAALRWSRVHDTETSLRLVGALRWFWVIQRDVTEGSGWLRGALTDRGGAPPEVIAGALNGVGLLAFRALDLVTARRAIEEACRYYEELDDAEGLAHQTYHLGILAWFEDDEVRADELLAAAAELAEASGDRWYLGWTLAIRGTIARCRDDFATAATLLHQSHDLFAAVGGSIDRGWSSLRLGALARDLGDYEAAAGHFSEGRVLLGETADPIGMAHADAGLAAIAWLKGSRDQALDLFARVLQAFATGDEAANNLFELKMMIQGDPTAEDLQRVAQWNKERATFEGGLGVKAALAEYLYHLGKTAYRQGHLSRARTALLESLTLCREAVDRRGVAVALIGLGCVLGAQGDHGEALMLYAAAAEVAEADGLDPWPPSDEPDWHGHVAATRARLETGDAERRWRDGRTMPLDEVVTMIRRRSRG